MDNWYKAHIAVILGLVTALAMHCSGQEIKTVAQCRSYREAWIKSADDDMQHLPVKVLLHRAEQMIACGKEIDTNIIKAGMSADDAMRAVILELGYPTLASAYYREAFNRAAWFIDSKHLTSEFLADDLKKK